VPAKADPDKQQEFLDERLIPRLAEAQANKRHSFFYDRVQYRL